MSKQPKTLNLEVVTIETIERLAAETRRKQGAIVDLAIEAYLKTLSAQSVQPKAKKQEAIAA